MKPSFFWVFQFCVLPLCTQKILFCYHTLNPRTDLSKSVLANTEEESIFYSQRFLFLVLVGPFVSLTTSGLKQRHRNGLFGFLSDFLCKEKHS